MSITKEQQSTAGNDTVNFVRFARLAEAGLDGHDYALDARLPHIPERWASPDLREAWITGYLTELRNRLSHQPIPERDDQPKRQDEE